MKKDKINALLKESDIVIPTYIYRLLPKLDIDIEVFVFIMYLRSFGEKIIFDPSKASIDLGIDMSKIMSFVDTLTTKGYLNFEVIKNNKNITNEYLSLSGFYDKVSLLLVDNIIEEDSSREEVNIKDIFNLIEKEFGRLLSPMENEIIKAWVESNYSEELIKFALELSVNKGITNLRYMDKTLYEWQKKGYKTRNDVEKINNNQQEKEKMEVFDYNWLDDDE